MNKYLKLALEQKLRDNDIEIGEKFRIQYWGVGYVYDGNELKEDYGVAVKFNDTDNVYGLLNNDFIKLPQYQGISFECAYKTMCSGKSVYVRTCDKNMVKLFISEADLYYRLANPSDSFESVLTHRLDYEFVNSEPSQGRIKFSDLYEYEFYEKINYGDGDNND